MIIECKECGTPMKVAGVTAYQMIMQCPKCSNVSVEYTHQRRFRE